MALTKTGSVVKEFTAVAQNVNADSGAFDISDSYKSAITIQAALDTTTAHTGTKFIVLVTPNAADDDGWGVLDQDQIDVELVGTALTENLTNDPLAAGSSVITCADTEGFETYGEGGLGIDEIPGWRFIEDGVDLEKSELIYQLSFVTDTSITIAGVTKNAHVQNTPMYNIGISIPVDLPDWAKRAKVIVMNTYDSNGSTLNYKILGGKVTTV